MHSSIDDRFLYYLNDRKSKKQDEAEGKILSIDEIYLLNREIEEKIASVCNGDLLIITNIPDFSIFESINQLSLIYQNNMEFSSNITEFLLMNIDNSDYTYEIIHSILHVLYHSNSIISTSFYTAYIPFIFSENASIQSMSLSCLVYSMVNSKESRNILMENEIGEQIGTLFEKQLHTDVLCRLFYVLKYLIFFDFECDHTMIFEFIKKYFGGDFHSYAIFILNQLIQKHHITEFGIDIDKFVYSLIFDYNNENLDLIFSILYKIFVQVNELHILTNIHFYQYIKDNLSTETLKSILKCLYFMTPLYWEMIQQAEIVTSLIHVSKKCKYDDLERLCDFISLFINSSDTETRKLICTSDTLKILLDLMHNGNVNYICKLMEILILLVDSDEYFFQLVNNINIENELENYCESNENEYVNSIIHHAVEAIFYDNESSV